MTIVIFLEMSLDSPMELEVELSVANIRPAGRSRSVTSRLFQVDVRFSAKGFVTSKIKRVLRSFMISRFICTCFAQIPVHIGTMANDVNSGPQRGEKMELSAELTTCWFFRSPSPFHLLFVDMNQEVLSLTFDQVV